MKLKGEYIVFYTTGQIAGTLLRDQAQTLLGKGLAIATSETEIAACLNGVLI